MILIRWLLILAAVIVAFIAGRASASPHAWMTDSSASRFDDSAIEIAALPEDGPRDPRSKTLLVARCSDNTMNFYIVFRDGAYIAPRSKVWIRLGTNAPVPVNWSISDGNSAVGLWAHKSSIEFAKQILEFETLFVRVEGDGRRSEAYFKLAGAAQAFEKARSACRW